MNSAPLDPALQAQVDAQLMEQGAYSALELLFNTGRLSYSDYEDWRRGELELLDGVLMGDPDKIRRQLDAAAGHARSIGLLDQPQEFFTWQAGAGEAPRKLRISADPALERLIAARFAPASDVPQMDLFFDNPVVALTSGIVRALTSRNADEAQRLVDRLYAQAPNHADLAGYDRLLEALAHLHLGIADVPGELAFLMEITPTARRLLGTQARDLLAPLWQQLATALAGQRFRSDQPYLHRSFALGEAQDWPALSACVLQEAEWWLHEPLCTRLAHSCLYLQRRDALAGWCSLCWRTPELAARLLEDRQRGRQLAGLWRQFCDDDEEADEAPDATDFPAWLLLHERGLAQLLAEDLATAATAGERHFIWVHQWIGASRAQREDEQMRLRRKLGEARPMLLRKLMKGV